MRQRTVTERVQVNGHSLHVQVDGPAGAPWLVLALSLGAALSLWEPQVAHFSQRYRVLRYDARGHGRSGVPPAAVHARCTWQRRAGVCSMRLPSSARASAGFPWVAQPGCGWRLTQPQRLDRLVLCNTTPWLGPPEPMNARIAQVLCRGRRAAGRGGFSSAGSRRSSVRWNRPRSRAVRQALLATPAAGYAGCCEAIRRSGPAGRAAAHQTPRSSSRARTTQRQPSMQRASGQRRFPGAFFIELPTAHISNIGAAPAFNAGVLAFSWRARRTARVRRPERPAYATCNRAPSIVFAGACTAAISSSGAKSSTSMMCMTWRS